MVDHFLNPRNVGDADEPSFTGRAASLVCGAHVRFSIQVDEAHRVSQARFRAAGCDVLVAAASMLTEQVTGLTTAEAAGIGANDLDHAAVGEKCRFHAIPCCLRERKPLMLAAQGRQLE